MALNGSFLLSAAMFLRCALADVTLLGNSFHGLKSSQSWLPRKPVVLSATGGEMMGDRLLPQNWDWRNVNGRNFVTADVNQHIPQYCGACWIHGTVAQLNDRIKIMRNAAFPDVMLSRQALINCVQGEKGAPAGCFGGDSWMIYEFMKDQKVPDETCSPYKAQNDQCLPWTICGNCKPPNGFIAAIQAGKDTSTFDMAAGCYPIPHYTGYTVSQFGYVKKNDPDAMMKEIYARGPISCMMMGDDRFMFNYSQVVEQNEGVYVDSQIFTSTDHVVEVAGWGETASGLKYWVVRNSWGTYWGQGGWFKMRRGVNQNLIEGYCSWAIPSFGDESLVAEGRVLGDYISGTHVVPIAYPLGLAAEMQVSLSSVALAMLAAAITSALFTGVLVSKLGWRRGAPQQPVLLG